MSNLILGQVRQAAAGLTRPWPLPVTTATVNVTGIDDTGATDVTDDLQAFIDNVPDGRIIMFGGAGKTYKISHYLDLQGRNNLIFDGNGCTLNNVANANGSWPLPNLSNAASSFYWNWAVTPPNHITIRNFIATHANPDPGVFQSGEHAAFLHAMDGSYLELDNITASGLFGDLLTLNDTPDHVWAHNCTATDAGRQFLSIMSGQDVLFESNVLGDCGYCAFDIEPVNSSSGPTTNVTIRNNTIGSWDNCFLAIDGVSAGCVITDITISGNIVSGKSLRTLATFSTSPRIQRLSFLNNRSYVSAAGPILRFAHIDTLTILGNVQPLSSGSLTSISDCTGVTSQ